MACFLRGVFRYIVNKQSIGDAIWCENVFTRHSVFQRIDHNVRYLKTETADSALIEEANAHVTEEEDDEVMAQKEQEIQSKRNKSRLNTYHRNLLHEKIPYSEPMDWFHETVRYKRKMYGRYGQSSEILPGIMWPTKEELVEAKEYESVAYPYTIQELITRMEEKKKEEQIKLKEREEDVLKKFAKLEQWKHDVRTNAANKLAAAVAAKAKKDKLVEEVRRHFGFKVDPKDERFQELIEKKEKEERKMAKDAKKKAKHERAMAHIEEMMKVGEKETK